MKTPPEDRTKPIAAPTTPGSAEAAETRLVRGETCASVDAQWAVSLVRNPQAFSERQVEQLYRLLKAEVAQPSTARERFDQLGLLIELLFDGNAVYPTTAMYQELHDRRPGEGWPDWSTLSRHYGGWPRAVNAAFRFYFVGGPARVPATMKHLLSPPDTAPGQRRFPPCSTLETLNALERFWLDHGVWPTKWEYEDWAWLRRRLERDDPRLPTLPNIYGRKGRPGLFDSFEDAVAAAQRRQLATSG